MTGDLRTHTADTREAKASKLRELHKAGQPLVLANIWDAASAWLAETAGFGAVATSSGAVAESLGHADHEGAPAEEMFAATSRITASVSVPVTMDAESGYQLPADLFVERLLATGAVGCNLEDTDHRSGRLVDIPEQAAWLAEVRAAASAAGVGLVINARIDVFLRAYANSGKPDERALLPGALRRAEAYLDAGADCVYPILVRQADTIERFVAGVGHRPVNIAYLREGLNPAELGALGVARVSLGTGLWRANQAWLTDRLAALAAGEGL
ncbi:MAG TPA: isocitrate lyase/phosphoenolpyruvate mutase family protein [Pseudonocardiaceae bacterium]|jgi:2-methylisocitrate lyase-like PEP mutase family enzyme|nr:isocitrate lyase/phosphoenolpyruvate mutase family protein [Pseudonocardiaceae bacterium]